MSVVVRGLVAAALLVSSTVAQAEPEPSAPAAAPPVRVYMRSDNRPLAFSARAKTSHGAASSCVAPCNAQFAPGDYQLKLNGVLASESVSLRAPGTLHGEFHSRGASRSGGWLALNVGGILGGVFITVGALGGPSWAYVAGGGALAGGSVLFVVTYRADSASVSFTPNEPLDVRGMPAPEARSSRIEAAIRGDHAGLASQSRGFGFRVAF